MSENIVKKRNWAFVLYPESAPVDWLDQIKRSGIMAAVSPLHDKDIDPDGVHKKEHYHIILVYGNPTTFNNVRNFCQRLNQPIPIALEQVIGMYRYLTHKDNPDKYQYNEFDIKCINGFHIRDFKEMTKSEIISIKRDISRFILDNNLKEYSDLVEFTLSSACSDDWFEVVSNNTLFFSAFLKSRFYRIDR